MRGARPAAHSCVSEPAELVPCERKVEESTDSAVVFTFEAPARECKPPISAILLFMNRSEDKHESCSYALVHLLPRLAVSRRVPRRMCGRRRLRGHLTHLVTEIRGSHEVHRVETIGTCEACSCRAKPSLGETRVRSRYYMYTSCPPLSLRCGSDRKEALGLAQQRIARCEHAVAVRCPQPLNVITQLVVRKRCRRRR